MPWLQEQNERNSSHVCKDRHWNAQSLPCSLNSNYATKLQALPDDNIRYSQSTQPSAVPSNVAEKITWCTIVFVLLNSWNGLNSLNSDTYTVSAVHHRYLQWDRTVLKTCIFLQKTKKETKGNGHTSAILLVLQDEAGKAAAWSTGTCITHGHCAIS